MCRALSSLLDNTPLRHLLSHVDLRGIDRAIASQALRAVSITCSGYNSGQSVSFFQGRADIEPWRRAQRVGAHVKIELDHLITKLEQVMSRDQSHHLNGNPVRS